MAAPDPVTTLDQILERIAEAKQIRMGRQRADLHDDLLFRLAAERVIEVLGEAVGRLPEDLRHRHPTVPWHRIMGIRNWLAHGYDVIDLDVLWDVIALRVDEVEAEFRHIREQITNNQPP